MGEQKDQLAGGCANTRPELANYVLARCPCQATGPLKARAATFEEGGECLYCNSSASGRVQPLFRTSIDGTFD